METYYPNQYPTLWSVDPHTQMALSGKTESYYAVLVKDTKNKEICPEQISKELQRHNCFLIVCEYSEKSGLSEASQSIIASHFGLLDTSVSTATYSWIIGAYAGLNRPLFILNRKNFVPELKCGAFRPALCISYESNEDILRQWKPLLPQFFRSLGSLNNFQTSLERFLEQNLKKLDSEQLRILKFFLLLEINPYTEEEIIAPLRSYSERCLDVFLSDWSELLVSLGFLQKKQEEVVYEEVKTFYRFPTSHLPILRKLLFHGRYFEPGEI